MCELAPPAMGAAAPEDAELPTITWSEYQRRVEEGAEQLILVAGAIIDVAELQEGEHKGGAVYNFGADMTNMFGGAHAHPPDRYSLHEPELRVVENVLKKVRRWTVALLDESTRPTDPSKIRIDLDGVPGYSQASEHKDLATTSADIGGGVPLVAAEHPWWEPSQAKVGTTAEASSSLAAQGLDVTTELGHACAGLAPGSVGARAFAAVMGLLRRRCGRDTVPLELRARAIRCGAPSRGEPGHARVRLADSECVLFRPAGQSQLLRRPGVRAHAAPRRARRRAGAQRAVTRARGGIPPRVRGRQPGLRRARRDEWADKQGDAHRWTVAPREYERILRAYGARKALATVRV